MAAAPRPGIDAVEFAVRSVERGAGELLVTSMDRDGTKIGFDLELTRTIADAVPVPVIASGGVGTLERPGRRRASRAMPAPCSPPRSSISAPITIAEAKAYMAKAGIAMRNRPARRGRPTSRWPVHDTRRAQCPPSRSRAKASPDESYTAKLLAAGARRARQEARRGSGRGGDRRRCRRQGRTRQGKRRCALSPPGAAERRRRAA